VRINIEPTLEILQFIPLVIMPAKFYIQTEWATGFLH